MESPHLLIDLSIKHVSLLRNSGSNARLGEASKRRIDQMQRKVLRKAVSTRAMWWKVTVAGSLLALFLGIATGGAGGRTTRTTAVATRSGLERAASAATGEAATAATMGASSFGPNVGAGVYDGESPAVSNLPVVPIPPAPSITARDNENLQARSAASNASDPVVQKAKGTGPISAPIANFDGICLPFGPPCDQASSCSCLPPDTNGQAGLNQYVEMVNSNFAVYSKTGTVLRTSTPINQLWAGTNSECATHNDGDPVIVYDQLANRWLLSQFIATPQTGEQYGECVAISTTSDATGAYYRYTFLFGSVAPQTFFDYPKFGVWPDGYYMSANAFPASQATSSGAGAFVFERSKMLTGQPARFVYFDESLHNPPGGQYIGQLPGNLDGSTLPPSGQPNLFAEVDDPSSIPAVSPDLGFDMRLWKFHVDWANPSNSTFGTGGNPSYTLPVAPFVRPQCVYGYGPNCVPQKGGPQQLDVLGDRLMFRLPIRNFGKHESVVLNHTVVADGRAGIRWYEVRIPTGGSPAIYQQGTYAPADSVTNPLWRWMGSAAMDRSGDLALGFSASEPADYPSVRYTGRATPGGLDSARRAPARCSSEESL
jgi:hypothetical protein